MKENNILRKTAAVIANGMLKTVPKAVDISINCMRIGGKDKLPKLLKK